MKTLECNPTAILIIYHIPAFHPLTQSVEYLWVCRRHQSAEQRVKSGIWGREHAGSAREERCHANRRLTASFFTSTCVRCIRILDSICPLIEIVSYFDARARCIFAFTDRRSRVKDAAHGGSLFDMHWHLKWAIWTVRISCILTHECTAWLNACF